MADGILDEVHHQLRQQLAIPGDPEVFADDELEQLAAILGHRDIGFRDLGYHLPEIKR
ncbi:hypothetical protein D3C83_69430 [compost metagenome]